MSKIERPAVRHGLFAIAMLIASGVPGAAQTGDRVPDEQLKAARDQHYPFIEQGAEPPGRFGPDPKRPDLRTWSGQAGWRTRHGSAIVWWSLGKPFKVEFARYPDGSLGEANHTLDIGWRRRAADGRHWIHGSVQIDPEGATFTDGTQPAYVPPPQTDVPNLEADLARDPAFLADVQDDRFAHAVYSVLNRSFYKGDDERPWGGGSRMAARMLRDFRGRGESYQDWFPYGGLTGIYPDDRVERETALRRIIEQSSQPHSFDRMVASIPGDRRGQIERSMEAWRAEFERNLPQLEEARLKTLETARQALAKMGENVEVFEKLRDHLTRLGWRVDNAEDQRRAQMRIIARKLVVLREIKELEKRPTGAPGEWTEPLRVQKGRVEGAFAVVDSASLERMSQEEREAHLGGVERRLRELALTGRIAKDEYDALSGRLKQR
jgi:hypothetical protein